MVCCMVLNSSEFILSQAIRTTYTNIHIEIHIHLHPGIYVCFYKWLDIYTNIHPYTLFSWCPSTFLYHCKYRQASFIVLVIRDSHFSILLFRLFFRSFVHSFILQVLFVQQKRFGHHFCPALAAATYSNSRIKCGEFKPLFIDAFMSSIKTEVDFTNIDGYCCHCYSCSFGCRFGLFLFFLPVFYAYSVAV